MISVAIQVPFARVSVRAARDRRARQREGRALHQPSTNQDPEGALAEPHLSALLARVAEGDRVAFKRLYDVAAPQLFAVALGFLRRREQAEDLLQDAFLAIWQKAAQFAPDRGQPMAWMAMIVRHRAIDLLRKAHRRPQECALDAQAPETARAAEGALTDSGRDICKALANLPQAQRAAVTLAFVEGLTHEEMALRLDAPLGTVKSWVRRGLLALKESLAT